MTTGMIKTRKELDNIISNRAKEYSSLNLKQAPKEYNDNLKQAFGLGFRDCIIYLNKQEITNIRITKVSK